MSHRIPLVPAAAALLLSLSACGGGVAAPDPGDATIQGPAPASAAAGSSAEAADDGTAPTGVDPAARATTGPTLQALPPADGIPAVADQGPLPVDLRIPDLGVDGAAVRAVGVENNGELEVPIASEVGWYRFGSAPGREGSSVLAAHIAYDGEDGVFVNLDSIEIGTEVEVDLEDGTTLTYRVVETATYDKTQLPFDDFFAESGPDRLVLITCGGDFNPDLRSYDSNVVALAEPVL